MKIKKTGSGILTVMSLALSLMVCLTHPASSKEKINTAGYLEIFGKVKNGNTALHYAMISVFCDNVEIGEYQSDVNGRFDVKLALNCEYYVHVSAKGMNAKILQINTALRDSALQYSEYEYKFNVNLVENTAGVEKPELLNKPVVKIIYSKDYDGFDYDKEYEQEMHDQGVFEHETAGSSGSAAGAFEIMPANKQDLNKVIRLIVADIALLLR